MVSLACLSIPFLERSNSVEYKNTLIHWFYVYGCIIFAIIGMKQRCFQISKLIKIDGSSLYHNFYQNFLASIWPSFSFRLLTIFRYLSLDNNFLLFLLFVQPLALLRSEEYRQLFRLPSEEVSDFSLWMIIFSNFFFPLQLSGIA